MRPSGMSRFAAVLLSAAVGQLVAPSSVRAEDAPSNLPPLKVLVEKSKVDLDGHRLELKMSRQAGLVQIKVYSDSGSVIADEEHSFAGRPAGSALVVTWSATRDEPVSRIELFAHDAYGYYSGVRIVPWSLSIPHDDVSFETNSASIQPGEEPKLEATLAQIAAAVEEHKDLGAITLFVAGHTDTVGTAQHNLELSQRRAHAIAAWFRRHGVKIPIASAGLGEFAPLVKTEDEVDEPRNRRVDYVLSIEEPRFKTSNRSPAWRRM